MAPELTLTEWADMVADINARALSKVACIQNQLALDKRGMVDYPLEELEEDLAQLYRILKGQRAPRLEDAPEAGR